MQLRITVAVAVAELVVSGEMGQALLAETVERVQHHQSRVQALAEQAVAALELTVAEQQEPHRLVGATAQQMAQELLEQLTLEVVAVVAA